MLLASDASCKKREEKSPSRARSLLIPQENSRRGGKPESRGDIIRQWPMSSEQRWNQSLVLRFYFFSVHNLLPRPEDGDVSLKRLWRRSQTLIVSSNEDSLSLSSIILKYLQLISRNSLKRPFLIDQMHRFLRMEVYHVAEREREIPLFFGHFKNSVIDSCHDSFRSVTISV